MRVLVVSAVVMLAGCKLPQNVVYACEPDGSCAIPGTRCGPDFHCYPADELPDDGGTTLDAGAPDAGPCVPRELVQACASAECGFVTDGCGVEVDCNKTCPAPQECGVSTPNHCGTPSLCTAEGWCWENPLPQGFNLNGAWRLDARHTWFVGENHVVLFFDGERSSLQNVPAPAGTDLYAIHGTALDDAFAVGSNGLLLHFNGTQWEREGVSSNFQTSLRTVWSLGGGRALAAGPGGRVLGRRPNADPFSRWSLETLPSTQDVRDVFSDPSGGEWLVTRDSQLFTRPQGSTTNWVLVSAIPLQETAAGLARHGGLTFGGLNNTSKATLVHRDADGGWRDLTDAGLQVVDLIAVDGGVFALSGNDFMWLDEADQVTRFSPPQNGTWNAGVALDGPRLFVGGPLGGMGVLSIDGGLELRSSPRPRVGHSLNAVCGVSPGQLYALGGADVTACNSTCRVRWYERTLTATGVEWRNADFQLGNTTQLLACLALGPDRVWFTGNDSKFISQSGGVPTFGDFGSAVYGRYSGAWGSAETGYFFTRPESAQVTFSDSGVDNFVERSVNANDVLTSVWGLGASDIVMVGRAGVVTRFDGAQWNARVNVGPGDFTAVHGAVGRFVAVGTNGALLSLEGPDASVVVPQPASVNFTSTWVAPNGTAWAGGVAVDGGAYLVRSVSGGPWLEVPVLSPRGVRGLTGLPLPDGGTAVWLVGPSGAIVRHD